jgi:hypothetical protein
MNLSEKVLGKSVVQVHGTHGSSPAWAKLHSCSQVGSRTFLKSRVHSRLSGCGLSVHVSLIYRVFCLKLRVMDIYTEYLENSRIYRIK